MDRDTTAALYAPAARAAAAAFPVEAGEIELVAVSENVTFRVTDANDDRRYVLRLHRPGYNSLAALRSERQWVQALNDAGIAAPRGVAARDGRLFVPVVIEAAGETRQAGMTHWTAGEVLAEALEGSDPALVERRMGQLGAIAAAIHNQASAWAIPPGFDRRILDAEGLIGGAPLWGRFWEHPGLSPGERTLILATRERIAGALARYARTPENFGLIHADLHTGNVLVDGDRLTVIDFDDAAFGWRQYEIAVALTPYSEAPNFAAVEAAFLAGYRGARSLPDRDAGVIAMFMLIRQLAVIGWLHQRPEIAVAERFAAMKAAVCAGCERFEAPC
ncbi:MAG TPA: phosphotransferase [Caulobacteraceae bacterium]|nr:phosphotransferase [Caulobacteraceae bacterium]